MKEIVAKQNIAVIRADNKAKLLGRNLAKSTIDYHKKITRIRSLKKGINDMQRRGIFFPISSMSKELKLLKLQVNASQQVVKLEKRQYRRACDLAYFHKLQKERLDAGNLQEFTAAFLQRKLTNPLSFT